MNNTLKTYIKNCSTIRTLLDVQTGDGKAPMKRIKAFALRALSNYTRLRLELLNNKNLMEFEQEAVTAAVKLGVKYAVTQFGVTLSTTTVDEAVEKIMPDVLSDVHSLRISFITRLLELADSAGK